MAAMKTRSADADDGEPMRRIACLIVALLAIVSPNARADQNQFWLAAQHDWGGKKGFFLTVGSDYPAGQTASLSSVRLTLGVADGSNWHFLTHDAKWEMKKPYTAKAVITATTAELWLDGKQVAKQDVHFVPAPQSAIAFNEQPAFLRGPAEYSVHQSSFHAHANDKQIDKEFATTNLRIQLVLLNPTAGAAREDLPVTSGVTVEAEFSLGPPADLRTLSPFIDRFGQSVQADWPGKVHDESELRTSYEEELKAWNSGRRRKTATRTAG